MAVERGAVGETARATREDVRTVSGGGEAKGEEAFFSRMKSNKC